MQCTSSKAQFLDDGTMWTMEEMVRLGKETESKKGEPQLGIKQQPWWPFIPISNYMVPLLHCEISISNQLLDKLRDIINEQIEQYGPTEELTRSSIPVLKNIISQTVTLRDAWDASADGKQLKALTCSVAAYRPRHVGEIIADARDGVANNDVDKQGQTHALEKTQLQALQDFCKRTFVDKLQKARQTLADQQLKLKAMQSEKVKGWGSIETRMFDVLLTEIGLELSSYHGGSLNGEDIKKVMNNATHVFDQVAGIFKEGKRPDCIMTDADIDALCLHF